MNEGIALIIEDSFTQAQIIGRMLKEEDWDFVTAKSIAESQPLLLHHRPRLVFVDIFLGEDNSLPYLQMIRDMAPDATIAVMTAGSRREAIDETLDVARRTHVDYVLRKPFSRKQIRGIVQTAEQDLVEGRRRRHALVVDDSTVVANLTAQILRDHGFRVSTAGSMEEALADVDIGHVDLAVCDIFMPGMGGLEGIKIIKATWPYVRIIAMSAGLEARISPDRAMSAAVRAGADAEIQKPFQAMRFIEVVVDVMA